MKSQVTMTYTLGLISYFSNAVIANAFEGQDYAPFADEVQEYTITAVKNMNNVIDSILFISHEDCTSEDALNLWNELFQQLTEVSQTLNLIASYDRPSREIASQSIEYLNRFISEAVNYPPFYQRLEKSSQKILEDERDSFQRYLVFNLIENQWQNIIDLYSYPQGNLDISNLLIAKSSRDSDRDKDDSKGGFGVRGDVTLSWDDKGTHWRWGASADVYDNKGNYLEGNISQEDDGSGKVRVRGGHENDHD